MIAATRAAARIKGCLSSLGPRGHWIDVSSTRNTNPTEGQSRFFGQVVISGGISDPKLQPFGIDLSPDLPHFFIQQIFTEHLLCARDSSGYWGYGAEQGSFRGWEVL